jgi:hypothetical protein
MKNLLEISRIYAGGADVFRVGRKRGHVSFPPGAPGKTPGVKEPLVFKTSEALQRELRNSFRLDTQSILRGRLAIFQRGNSLVFKARLFCPNYCPKSRLCGMVEVVIEAQSGCCEKTGIRFLNPDIY